MNYLDILQPLIKKFLPFAQETMKFSDPPRLFLKSNSDNASNPLGKTAYYDPNNKSITVYITNRHPKDIMRSLSHELVHHTQNCRGEFDKLNSMGDGYAQNDEHLREMEREAYEIGNLCFRDWEDSVKNTIYFEHLQKGENKMSTKDWKNKEIKSLLSEAWGFKMDLSKLNEGKKKPDGDGDGVPPWADKDDDDPDVQEEGAFSANHYCIHHGGVHHNGKTEMAEAVNHNYNKELGKVTHYDMKLADGTILENVAAEDIEVTNASLAEEHEHPMKRDDDEEELDEQSRTDSPDRARPEGGRRLDEEDEDEKDEEVQEEVKKLDFKISENLKNQMRAQVRKMLSEQLKKQDGKK